MNWLSNLFIGEGVAHSVMVLALVIAAGTVLAKIKIKGISIGVTWILFMGILASHFGLVMDSATSHFVKEFGLILFIYSIGLQLGPGFFESFRKGGVKMNLLAALLVLLSVLTAIALETIFSVPHNTMLGILSGAVTNTPGLGAAQQTLMDVHGIDDTTIPMAYAVTYPLGAVGVILTMLLLKWSLRVSTDKEKAELQQRNVPHGSAKLLAVEVHNETISGKTILEINKLIDRHFVISLIVHPDGHEEIPGPNSVIHTGDHLRIVTSHEDEPGIVAFLGEIIPVDLNIWGKLDSHLELQRLLVTRRQVNGKTLGELNLRAHYGINITRIHRSGVDLVAVPELHLQIGDTVTVIGQPGSISKAANILGNSPDQLREPNLFPIFIGIALGVILGSLPIAIPGLPQPVKLGLAGGPLIIAILMARFGPGHGLVTYTTLSANKMLREIGISLFLAVMGLSSGKGFVDALFAGGWWWILYGALITMIPTLIIGFLGRYILKLDYFSITGLLSGSQTNPVALAFANNSYGVPQITTVYATVYPLTMFLRILAAQLLAL